MDSESNIENITKPEFPPNVVKRVKKFQIMKGTPEYKELDELCLKTRNMFNYTLFILRHLYFASKAETKERADYFLSRIDENVRKYVSVKMRTYKSKKDGDKEKTVSNYYISFKAETGNELTDEKALFAIFLRIKQPDYLALQSTAARNAVKTAVKSMKSYKASLIKYSRKPSDFLGEPKLPRYQKGKYDRIVCSLDTFKTDKKNGAITINGNCKLQNVHFDDKDSKVKSIRVVPKPTMNTYVVEVIYEKTIDRSNVSAKIDPNKSMAIDVGVNTVCAVTTSDGEGFLMNGRALKNINQFYNKNVAELQQKYSKLTKVKSGKKRKMLERKRQNKIDTFMHQLTRYLIDFAVENGIGKIIVGHNENWKQKPFKKKKGKERKRLCQNFVQIPFNGIISKLTYKGEEYGIEVVEVEEPYTSKCSALDHEEICEKENENYLGKRGGRHSKEYVTGERGGNVLVNADINGSLNIMRLGENSDRVLDNLKTSILTPPKVNSVGFRKFSDDLIDFRNGNPCRQDGTDIHSESDEAEGDIEEMQPQNAKSEKTEHMSVEATVDSHCNIPMKNVA